MRGGAGCGFSLLKNAGPRPVPHKGEKFSLIFMLRLDSIMSS
jgi:hypothetical protein